VKIAVDTAVVRLSERSVSSWIWTDPFRLLVLCVTGRWSDYWD